MKKEYNKSMVRNIAVLDVHGYTSSKARTLVYNFISEQNRIGNDRCIIVYGKETIGLKESIRDVLQQHKDVESFFTSSINEGQMLVYISSNGIKKGEIYDRLSPNELLTIKKSTEFLSVKYIIVKNVLGKFQYEIEFNDENKIFIIHAPNGCGKSNLLKIIRYFMNNEFKKLQACVFEEIIIVCENSYGRNYEFSHKLDKTNEIIISKNGDLDLLPECLFITNINKKNNNNQREFYEEDFEDRIKTFDEIMNSFFCYEKKVKYKKIKKGNEKMYSSKYKTNIEIEYIDYMAKKVPNLYEPGRKIKFSMLSSGEQFIIKLFHDLIFNLKPNGFVELDEPELSLHPEWQELMIKKLVEVSNKYNIRILIATHSPYLLNNLDVKVGNPEYEK